MNDDVRVLRRQLVIVIGQETVLKQLIKILEVLKSIKSIDSIFSFENKLLLKIVSQ